MPAGLKVIIEKYLDGKALFASMLIVVILSGMSLADASGRIADLVKKEVVKRDVKYKHSKIDVYFKDWENIFSQIDSFGRDVELKIAFPENRRLAGKLLLPVEVFKNNSFKNKFNIYCSIGIFEKVLVSTKKIGKGDLISKDSVALAEKDICLFPQSVITDAKMVEGKEASTYIPEGRVLLDWMLKESPQIRKGDMVDIILNSPGISIKARGMALDDALINSMVRVKNSDSGKIIEALLINSKEVEIK